MVAASVSPSFIRVATAAILGPPFERMTRMGASALPCIRWMSQSPAGSLVSPTITGVEVDGQAVDLIEKRHRKRYGISWSSVLLNS